jgi:hypothetical protein
MSLDNKFNLIPVDLQIILRCNRKLIICPLSLEMGLRLSERSIYIEES